MLDKDYILEISGLEKKEAKEKLAEYADTFGIKLKKTKAFDNMVQDLEVELARLANEPMPEVNEGLSIYDLIQADDEASGQSVFKDEAKEEARLLIDSIGTPEVKPFVMEAPIGDKVIVVSDKVVIEAPAITINSNLDAAIESVIESEKEPEYSWYFELPKGFSPTLNKMGKGSGYVTLPWWIYEWIAKTPDWKSNPKSFEHPSAHSTLFSLIYYINREGSIRIRETRNSSFQILS